MLPPAAFFEIMVILRTVLPAPFLDEPEEWARRDQAAMAAVDALQPATAAEGRLAAQFVSMDAHGMDCLLLATERRREREASGKCRAQAVAIVRESKSSLRMLQVLQAKRRALARDEVAASQAEWVEHAAVGMMARALGPDADVGGVAAPLIPEAEVSTARVPKSGPVPKTANNSRERRVETTTSFYEDAPRALPRRGPGAEPLALLHWAASSLRMRPIRVLRVNGLVSTCMPGSSSPSRITVASA